MVELIKFVIVVEIFLSFIILVGAIATFVGHIRNKDWLGVVVSVMLFASWVIILVLTKTLAGEVLPTMIEIYS